MNRENTSLEKRSPASTPAAPFAFGTKAETLERLAPQLTEGRCCEQMVVSVRRWTAERDVVTAEIIQRFRLARLAVRSSAGLEDTWEKSNAGALVSVTGVEPSLAAVSWAIDDVIRSYGADADDQEVLIQPMVENVTFSGVVLTRDLDTGGPYYVINYDDYSGRTDTVTSGGVSKMVMVHRSKPEALHSPRMRKVVAVAREIEALTGCDELDIEFCGTSDLSLYVLQVRPLAAKRAWNVVPDREITKVLDSVRAALPVLLRSSPGLAGSTTILGEMPDWNPAEMIGITPRPLALSLYKRLITDRIWADARAFMGYRPVMQPLMIDFFGRPYIDVRLSLNSFLPAALDDNFAHRLVDHQLMRLADNRALHDKIEFEIAVTCRDLDYSTRARALEECGFSKSETDQLGAALGEITSRVLAAGTAGLNAQLALTRQVASDRVQNLQNDPLACAQALLARTVTFGTLPFAILARHGFIAVAMLRSMVARGVIAEADRERFMLGIDTVVAGLVYDIAAVAAGRLDRDAFLATYGHLRPGTYDILSWRYDENPDLYLGAAGAGARPVVHLAEPYHLSATQRKALTACLAEHGYDIRPNVLMDYIAAAIGAREEAKFAFSHGVSDALVALERWGEGVGLSRDDLSYLDVDTIFQHRDDPARLRDAVDKGRAQHRLTRAVRLNHLIVEPSDIDVVYPARGQPNFITNKSVTAPYRHLHTNEAVDLKGCIVMIESADPGFDWIFSRDIAGLITQYGGANSHMTIRCAEFGLPAAIGCGERLFQQLLRSLVIELDCAARRVTGH